MDVRNEVLRAAMFKPKKQYFTLVADESKSHSNVNKNSTTCMHACMREVFMSTGRMHIGRGRGQTSTHESAEKAFQMDFKGHT